LLWGREGEERESKVEFKAGPKGHPAMEQRRIGAIGVPVCGK